MASFCVLLCLLLLPVIFLFLRSKTISSKSNYRLPPGPWTIPIIGSLHHLIRSGQPHHALRDLARRYGDLMSLQLGEVPAIVVSSKEPTREILKTHGLTFSSRPAYTNVKIWLDGAQGIVFAPYGKHWRDIRKICVLELLSSKQVESFGPIREDETGSLIQQISSSLSSRHIVNLSEKLMVLANNVTLRAIIGSKFKDQHLIINQIQEVLELATGFNLANLFPSSRVARLITGAGHKSKECRRVYYSLMDSIIREHREKEADGEEDDFLRVLLRLHDEDSENNSLSIETIKAVVLDLILAGTDTTATTLDWIMTELMRNPTLMKKAQTEVRQQFQGRQNITELDLSKLHFMHLIIKETLRLHPAAPFLVRDCPETCKISGYDISEGTRVIINLWAIGRDSKYWKDVDEFKPDRFVEYNSGVNFDGNDLELIPFGAGRRICPGMSFGLATIKIALANLLYHFNWELACEKPHELDMTETFGLATRRKMPLLLYAQPYDHAIN